jgi:hypothetical protein
VIVFWPLLVNGQSFAIGDIAVEVVTCRTYCDPIGIGRVSCRPPKFNPATMLLIENDWVIPLCCQGFRVVSD